MVGGGQSAEDEGEEGGVVTSTQLGFSEPIDDLLLVGHRSPNWEDWDGGQIGGKPSWLNPQHLPLSPLDCKKCGGQLRFLCQLYAPADQVCDDAYHRSLYVFGCAACGHDNDAGKDDVIAKGSIRVLRTQLPQQNLYYPLDVASVDDHGGLGSWNKHLPESHGLHLCRVCGQRGKGKCPIQKHYFCCRAHQKEHKKHIFDAKSSSSSSAAKKKQQQQQDDEGSLPSVYQMSEMVVEEEPPQDEDDKKTLLDVVQERTTDPYDSDQDLEQDDLNQIVTGTTQRQHDPATLEFNVRIARARNQCLRYCPQWRGEPLWIQSKHQPPPPSTAKDGNDDKPQEVPPPCEYCGAPRKLEFQLMPQMLQYLLQNRPDLEKQKQQEQESALPSATARQALSAASHVIQDAPPEQVPPVLKDQHDKTIRSIQQRLTASSTTLEWGVVGVYTCTKSCAATTSSNELGAYLEEYAWRQPAA